MITREEIILELKANQDKTREGKKIALREFMEELKEPQDSIEKILSDLESYEGY